MLLVMMIMNQTSETVGKKKLNVFLVRVVIVIVSFHSNSKTQDNVQTTTLYACSHVHMLYVVEGHFYFTVLIHKKIRWFNITLFVLCYQVYLFP